MVCSVAMFASGTRHPTYGFGPQYGTYTATSCQQTSQQYDPQPDMAPFQQNPNAGSWAPAVYAAAPSTPRSYEDWLPPSSPGINGYGCTHLYQRQEASCALRGARLSPSEIKHSPPGSVVAVSSDGLSGSESPGATQNILQGTLSRPQPARSPYEWMKKTSYQSQPNPGKTRTKDKYRVVYTDHQRLELEKEFHYSRYITIRRKSELAAMLGLSERQVKIWFQNRRAKDRKQAKKRQELLQKTKEPMLQANTAAIATLGLFKPIIHFDQESAM